MMIRGIKRGIKIVVPVISIVVVLSCATIGGKGVSGKWIDDKSEVEGNYTVILYGSHDKRVALLDLEGDAYTFKPFDPEYEYRIIESLPGSDAMERSVEFLSSHEAYSYARLKRITDKGGNIIGYEVKPRYMALRFGFHDIFEVYYSLEGDTVRVYVQSVDSVKRLREWDDIN